MNDVVGGRGFRHGRDDSEGEEDRDGGGVPPPFEEVANPFGHDFEAGAFRYKMTGVVIMRLWLQVRVNYMGSREYTRPMADGGGPPTQSCSRAPDCAMFFFWLARSTCQSVV